MDGRFHTSQLLKSLSTYPVSKGDLPGHAFHGNQYATAGELANGVKQAVINNLLAPTKAGTFIDLADGARRLGEMHQKAQEAHITASRQLHDDAERGMLMDSEYRNRMSPLQDAISAHGKAIDAHAELANHLMKLSQLDAPKQSDVNRLSLLADKARDASDRATAIEQSTSGANP